MVIRDSFRKISKGGQKHVRRQFGGGGRVQWAIFNFEGLQFPRGGGGHKVFKGGGGNFQISGTVMICD